MTANWQLSYPGTALDLGLPSSGVIFEKAPEPSDLARSTNDRQKPRGDGELFGRDFTGGRTWSFELGVIGRDDSEVLERLARLEDAWDAESLRKTPRAVAQLRAHTGRSTFGRPRRFAASADFLRQGYLQAGADFRAIDRNWYDAVRETQVDLVPALGGGLKAPLRAPLITTATSDRSKVFDVGGRNPTGWWVMDVAGGGIVNPVLEVVGVMRFELGITVAYDQPLVIDGRRWAMEMLRGGTSVAGAVSRRSTRFDDALIPPGRHQLLLRGAVTSGNPRLRLQWCDAYPTY